MREVGVHLADELRAARRARARSRPGTPCPSPPLPRAVEHLDDAELGADALGDRAGAVGRAVVDDEDAVVARRGSREHRGDGAQQRARSSAASS